MAGIGFELRRLARRETLSSLVAAVGHAAVVAAGHDIVVRVDGHAELSDGYIATAVRELRATGAVNVGGIMDAEGQTPVERAVACAMRSRNRNAQRRRPPCRNRPRSLPRPRPRAASKASR